MKRLIAGLALACALAAGCAPVGGAPLLSTPQATLTAVQTEASAEAALNAAEDLWRGHKAQLPADRRAQAWLVVKRIPAARRALRQAQDLGTADSLQAQIAAAIALAKDATAAIAGASPATPPS